MTSKSACTGAFEKERSILADPASRFHRKTRLLPQCFPLLLLQLMWVLSAPAATFVVTSTNAAGNGSLHWAITNANAGFGPNSIVFSITGAPPFVIRPTNEYPLITEPIRIDGTTQPGYAGTPVVEINGSMIVSNAPGAASTGIQIGAGDSTVRGLAITGFKGSGIGLVGGWHNVVEGNHLGIDTSGRTNRGNAEYGIKIFNGSSYNILGGPLPAQRNVISGNWRGIGILTADTFENVIEGNYVGTDLSGTRAIGNTNYGILITGSSTDNTIGGPSPMQRNLISANRDGVWISGQSVMRTTVQGNFIGIDSSGTRPLGNLRWGVSIEVGAQQTLIGGTIPGSGNVISGNGHSGVRMADTETQFITIQGNYVGTDATGSLAIGNENGVGIYDSAHEVVVEGNLISGNQQYGITVYEENVGNRDSANVVIRGNYIGLDKTGTRAIGNGYSGVRLFSGGVDVGGTMTAHRNVISGNGDYGIKITRTTTSTCTIKGNFIGTDASGNAGIPNILGGFQIERLSVVIGGPESGAGNVISGNRGNGITIETSSASGNLVQGNKIGVGASGPDVAIGNTGNGIFINGASGNVIGLSRSDTDENRANVIGWNGMNGVVVVGASARGNTVRANRIFFNGRSSGGLAIDLGGNGRTANDKKDMDSGPNDLLNYPRATAQRGEPPAGWFVCGRVDIPNLSGAVVDVYGDGLEMGGGYAQAPDYYGSASVDPSGRFRLSLPSSPAANVMATVTDAAGSTSELSPPATDAQLVALEVIQVVQDWNNSVPLVAGKTTIVRAHIKSLTGNAVKACLRAFRNGVEVGGSPIPPLNPPAGGFLPSQDPYSSETRGNFNSSLNFELPPVEATGNLDLWLDGEGIACAEPAGSGNPGDDCSDCSVKVSFTQVAIPRFRFYAVAWVSANVVFRPSYGDVEEVANRIRLIYPVADIQSDIEYGYYEHPATEVGAPDTCVVGQVAESNWGIPHDTIGHAVLWPPIPQNGCTPVGSTIASAAYFGSQLDSRQAHAHEIGHNLGRSHPHDRERGGGCCCHDPGEDFPYYADVTCGRDSVRHPVLGPDNLDEVKIFGLDIVREKIFIHKTSDLMSYCRASCLPESWMSKHTYVAILDAINARTWGSPLRLAAFPDTEYLVIRGKVDTTSGLVAWLPFYLTTSQLGSEPLPAGSAWTLRLLDGAGAPLQEVPFRLEFNVTGATVGQFQLTVVTNVAIRSAEVRNSGILVARLDATQNTPAVQALSSINMAEQVSISWQGFDADGDSLTYFVQYSSDGGVTWRTMAVDLVSTHLDLPMEFLKSTTNAVVRVLASDGFLVGKGDTVSRIMIGNHPPSVRILRPATNEVFAGDFIVVFEASANDAEDGLLLDDAFQWRSSLNGLLGTGHILHRSLRMLSVGNHVITVTAVDSGGLTNSASMSLRVDAEPVFSGRPQLSIRPVGTNQYMVAWPGWGTNFVLEAKAALSSPAWVPFNFPVIRGEENTVTFPRPSSNRFFRLRR